jgi:REP element-mobilizing transposase RayT
VSDIMQLNDAGRMIQQVWDEIPSRYPGVDIDAFVVMPNHVHGIVVLVSEIEQPDGTLVTSQKGGMALGDVVHRFKSFTTTQYRRGVKTQEWKTFPGQLWQRDYYDHVIRSEEELNRIRQYIFDNPAQWALDRENSSRA